MEEFETGCIQVLSGCFNKTSCIGHILVAVFGTSLLARVIACKDRGRELGVTRSTCHKINSHEINSIFCFMGQEHHGAITKKF